MNGLRHSGLPEWTAARIKHVSTLKGRLGWQGLTADEYRDEGPYVVSSAHFRDGRIHWDACPHVSDERYRVDRNIQLSDGDILLMKDGAALGKLAFIEKLPGPACLNSHLLLFRPRQNSYWPRFIYFVLTSPAFQDYMSVVGTGATFLGVSQNAIGNFQLALPDVPQQRAIADFLDHKTAAIDALIEKKERLIALLEEKRQALITQAVTKGLDPSVPMKDSGIEWLGEIPAHWEVKRLKNMTTVVTSGSRGWGQYYSDAGPLFLRIANVLRDSIDLVLTEGKRQCVSAPPGAEGARTLAMHGDVLVTITADIGSVGVVPRGLGEAYVSQHIALCRPTDAIAPRLLAYLARSPWGRVHYELCMNGGTKVGLTLDDVRNTPLAVPPRNEQAQILEHVDGAVTRIHAAETTLSSQLDRLREYRQALITAAVTGQLDIPEAPAEARP